MRECPCPCTPGVLWVRMGRRRWGASLWVHACQPAAPFCGCTRLGGVVHPPARARLRDSAAPGCEAQPLQQAGDRRRWRWRTAGGACLHRPCRPAILVVGHQTDGKSALVEALMGFQFNHVGGGTKTRRPITLHMTYNSDW